MLIDIPLIQVLELKAYDDWISTFSYLDDWSDSATKKEEHFLIFEIKEASVHWHVYDFNQKHAFIQKIIEEISGLYNIEAPGVFTQQSWSNFMSGFPHMTYSPSSASNAFFTNVKARNKEYACIVILNDDLLLSSGFMDVMRCIIHELGHAIIDDYGKKLREQIPPLITQWQNRNDYLNQIKLHPLHSVGFLKFYLERTPSYKKLRNNIIKNATSSYTASQNPHDDNFYHYWMLWEERCAEAFAQNAIIVLQKLLDR